MARRIESRRMSDSSAGDDGRAIVTTYVPEYQKQEWAEHAERLDMSQSEFVKTMVQAGRRGFGEAPKTEPSGRPSSGAEPQGTAVEDGVVDPMRSTVLDLLDTNETMSWQDLLDEVTEDVEVDLEEAITALQEANEITHSPRRGGYVRMEE